MIYFILAGLVFNTFMLMCFILWLEYPGKSFFHSLRESIVFMLAIVGWFGGGFLIVWLMLKGAGINL